MLSVVVCIYVKTRAQILLFVHAYCVNFAVVLMLCIHD